MTQQKAASLTSSLFARKGKASPARLLISEMEGAETDTLDPAETAAATAAAAQAASQAASGAAGKVNGVNGTARRKPKAAEPELPLLAFVEAQDAAEGAAPNEYGMVDHDAETGAAGERPPAASLLERGAQSLRRTNGRAVDFLSTPAEAAAAGALMPVASDIEIVIAPDPGAGTEEGLDGDEATEAETVSGDANVAAIEDAPHDDEPDADEAPQSAAPTEVTIEVEAVAAEDAPEDAAVVEPADMADKAASAAAEGGESDDADSAALESGDAEQQTTPALTPAPAAAQPWTAQHAAGDRAMPATVALRKAAALNPAMPASAGFSWIDSRPEPAVPPVPPPAARPALPWRSAAVVVLGAMLGLGGYLAMSGKPAQPPAEIAGAPAADGPAAESLPVPQQAAADPATAAEAPAAPATVAEAPATLPEPSFDIIRIEPDGQSIIAGRAQPHSAWILLNNGSPIATVQADANGEWVVLPDASLVPGANAFSLVPKTERGKVAIPAPVSSSSSGASQDGAPAVQQRANEAAVPQGAPAPAQAGPDVALPKPKPEAAVPAANPAVPPAAFRVTPDGDYEVQVASVREVADAERERGRLAASFPTLLGELDLRVQEASVEGAGTFFRVRSGGIADLGVARELCRQLEAAGQGCLVVRRAVAPEAPKVEAVAGQATEPAAEAASPAQQQAERPQ